MASAVDKKKTQITITRALQRKQKEPAPDDELIKLEDEVNELERTLLSNQVKCYQRHCASLRQKRTILKPLKKPKFTENPKELRLELEKKRMDEIVDLYLTVTGLRVETFENDLCIILFNIPTMDGIYRKHTIEIGIDKNKNTIRTFSMPLGFQLEEIREQFDDDLESAFILALYKGLNAYYRRNRDIAQLKETVPARVNVFPGEFDGTKVTITQDVGKDTGEKFQLKLTLGYDVLQCRPKEVLLGSTDLSDAQESRIKKQCKIFLTKPLNEAFATAFQNSNPEDYQCLATQDSQDALADFDVRPKGRTSIVKKGKKPTKPRVKPQKSTVQDQGYDTDSSGSASDFIKEMLSSSANPKAKKARIANHSKFQKTLNKSKKKNNKK